MRVFLFDPVTLSAEALQQLWDTLPPERAAAAARCRRSEGQLQTVVGFCLVRYALRQLSPGVNTDTWELAPGGKPHLAAGKPFFNLTHTTCCIAVAVSEQEEVGIDVEEIKPHHKGLAERFCSKSECTAIAAASDPASEMIRYWSAKEAEVKRLGVGIGQGLTGLTLDRVVSQPITSGGIRHWLSVAPAITFPPVEWVSEEQLLADIQ